MSIINEDSNKAFDGKTMIAIVMMVVVITAGMALQNYFFPKPAPQPSAQTAQSAQGSAAQPGATPAAVAQSPAPQALALADTSDAPLAEMRQVVSTDLFEATFTNKGGELVSLKLKKQLEGGAPLEMIQPVKGDTDGFALAIGGPGSAPIDALMNASRPAPGVIEFSRTFMAPTSSGEQAPFSIKKRFEFVEGEYMFRVSVTVTGDAGRVPAIGGEAAYTLTVGPQIGPSVQNLHKNADFRRVVTYEEGKRKQIKPGLVSVPSSKAAWAAIAGKYFTVLVMPEVAQYSNTYSTVNAENLPVSASMSFSRAPLSASTQTDVFYVYAGPKLAKELARYDDPTANAFKRTGSDLEGVLDGGNMLGWLATLLKWSLNFFYALVHNYGIAIILVTVLVKILMFPLTFKGSQSTARMQELQPKIQELQAKYKNNPQKLNQEMAEFYKAEGYNPLSGCLPMLIQLPIFIAMYSLFNNHFDLRGAVFIPGWINDLSLPEAVYEFKTINLVIWKVSAIRILPIIYVVSQLLYGKFTQQPTSAGQSQGQMKFMMYGMPIMFFFILYDVPSGLLVYWIASNLLTLAQQIFINQQMKKRREAKAAAEPALKIVPPKARGGSKKGRG